MWWNASQRQRLAREEAEKMDHYVQLTREMLQREGRVPVSDWCCHTPKPLPHHVTLMKVSGMAGVLCVLHFPRKTDPRRLATGAISARTGTAGECFRVRLLHCVRDVRV